MTDSRPDDIPLVRCSECGEHTRYDTLVKCDDCGKEVPWWRTKDAGWLGRLCLECDHLIFSAPRPPLPPWPAGKPRPFECE